MFNNLIVAYLFLGGMGAGACCVLCMLSCAANGRLASAVRSQARPDIASQRFFGFGFLIATALCAVGAFCLLADLKRPDEVLVLLTSPTLSVVSVGAYTLIATMLCGVFSGLVWLRAFVVPPLVMRVVVAVHIVLSCAVMVYTALLLMAFSGVPFFRTPLIIALFLASSLSCGTAAVVVIAVVTRAAGSFRNWLRRLALFDMAVLVIELLVLLAFMVASARVAPQSAWRLLDGACSVPFWTLVVGGLCAPLVLYGLELRLPALHVHPLLPACLVMAGGFVLRWCILAAA